MGVKQANAAAEKAKLYAHKLDLAVQIDATLSELALRMSNLISSRHVGQEAEQVLALRKDYAADFQFLKDAATNDEDRGLLRKIEEVIIPWRDLNNKIMEAAQAGKHLDGVKVREEALDRFGALKSAVAEYLTYRQMRMDTMQQEQLAMVSEVRLMADRARAAGRGDRGSFEPDDCA